MKVIWKQYIGRDILGKPLLQGGWLDTEGEQVFEKIASMPKGKPITPYMLDHLICDEMQDGSIESAKMVVSTGPIAWCIQNGFHIVYSRSDYQLVSES